MSHTVTKAPGKPLDDRRFHGERPDFKLRPGFSNEELEDWQDFVVKNGGNSGALARRALLTAMGKTPADIKGGEE